MFEVRFFVDDKKLAKVLWALDGEIAGMPSILPVGGAKVEGTKIKATTDGSSMTSRFQQALEADNKTKYAAAELKDMLEKLGAKRQSGATFIKTLVDRGILKGTGVRGHYTKGGQ